MRRSQVDGPRHDGVKLGCWTALYWKGEPTPGPLMPVLQSLLGVWPVQESGSEQTQHTCPAAVPSWAALLLQGQNAATCVALAQAGTQLQVWVEAHDSTAGIASARGAAEATLAVLLGPCSSQSSNADPLQALFGRKSGLNPIVER